LGAEKGVSVGVTKEKKTGTLGTGLPSSGKRTPNEKWRFSKHQDYKYSRAQEERQEGTPGNTLVRGKVWSWEIKGSQERASRKAVQKGIR